MFIIIILIRQFLQGLADRDVPYILQLKNLDELNKNFYTRLEPHILTLIRDQAITSLSLTGGTVLCP